MAKEILLLGRITEYNVLYWFDQLKDALKDNDAEELNLRINCTGGSPEYGQSILSKYRAIADQTFVEVDGMAHSMALFILCYTKKERVSVLSTTQAVLHRAAYPPYWEKDPAFAESIEADSLARTNKDLEKALRNSADIEALESLPQMKNKNLTVKDIFSMDARHEVLLTGADLVKIGLAGKMVNITPKKSAEISAMTDAFEKCNSVEEFRMAASVTAAPPKQESQIEHTIMDLNELKTKFPGIYAQAKAEGHAEGVTAGIAAEKDRVEAIMVYADVDAEACKAAVESGKPLSAKQMAEFNRKMISKEALTGAEADSAADVTTGDPKEAGKAKDKAASAKVQSFETEVDKIVGLKK